MTKPFDPELYDRDDRAKDFVRAFFEQRFGFIAYVNPDQYGIDLIIENDRGKFELEVEVKQAWTGRNFPYKTLHYAARKIKFAENLGNVHFITLNKNWTWGLLVSGDVIATCKIVTKDTIYTKNEKFIEVPLDKCSLLKLF